MADDEAIAELGASLRFPLYRHPTSKMWLPKMLEGNWAAIPEDLTFEEAIDLCYLIDGHALSSRLIGGGHAEEVAFFDAELMRVQGGGEWEGSAVELWLLLFIAQRLCVHSSLHMSPGVIPHLNKVVLKLRAALQVLPPLPTIARP